MLRNRDAALGLILFLALGGYSVWEMVSSQHAPYHEAQKRSNYSPQSDIDPRKPDERIADYTLWLERFTGLLALISIVQIGFLISADKNTRIAAEAASLHARAAVGVELPAIFVTGVELLRLKGKSDDLAAQLSSPEVNIAFRNFGRTPAILVQRCVNITVAAGLPENPTYLVIDEYQPGNIIESKSIKTEQHGAIGFGRDIATEILDGNEFLWVYGFLIYQDFLRDFHEIGFCARWFAPFKDSRDAFGFGFGPEKYTYIRNYKTPPPRSKPNLPPALRL